jgi:hypothetical protein
MPMLKPMQIQHVAEKLAGQPLPLIRPGDMDEPWDTLFQNVERLDDLGLAGRTLWKILDEEGIGTPHERNEIINQVIAALPSAHHPYRSLLDVAARLPPVRWLWPSWLPRGMLSLLGAAPGAGKSLVALDLARRLTGGGAFPDGAPVPGQERPVLYVDAESVPQIQNQRAQAWGMDRSRLFLMMPDDPYEPIDFGSRACQDLLVDMCYHLEPDLVVIDSLGAIHLKGENNVEDVRAVLGYLCAVAQEFDLSLLLIHHLRKRGKERFQPSLDAVAADEFRGSSHIVAMARSVLALSHVQVGPEPDRNGPRRLEIVKTNLCRYPPALGVHFEPAGPGSDTHSGTSGDTPSGTCDGGAPLLRYTGPPRPYRPPTRTDDCAAWLLGHLEEAGEPQRPRDVIEAAREAGFSRTMTYRARADLGESGQVVDVHTSSENAGKRWALASED